MNSTRSRGVILLEVLFALAASFWLYFIAARVLQASVRSYTLSRRAYHNAYTLLRVQYLLEKVMDDLDTAPFVPLPMVYPAAEAGQGHHPGALDSHALTAVAVALNAAHTVLRVQRTSADTLQFTACPRFAAPFDAENYAGYYGLAVDGMYEMIGTASRHAGREECRDFVLQVVGGGTASASADTGAETVRLLVPIAARYTLYVDRTEQLRYVGYRGGSVVENQPLCGNVRQLTLAFQPPQHGVTCIDAALTFHDGRHAQLSACNRLGRFDPLSFLLNKP